MLDPVCAHGRNARPPFAPAQLQYKQQALRPAAGAAAQGLLWVSLKRFGGKHRPSPKGKGRKSSKKGCSTNFLY